VDSLEAIRVSAAIRPILESGEVRERRTNWETRSGGKASFTSPGRKHSVDSDLTLRKMEEVGRESLQGSLGNMYWLPEKNGCLKGDLHSFLNKKDQRMSVMGERNEEEVRYVTSRVRAYCK